MRSMDISTVFASGAALIAPVFLFTYMVSVRIGAVIVTVVIWALALEPVKSTVVVP